MDVTLIVGAVAFLLSAGLVLMLRRPAAQVGLMDHPGGRKQHHKGVPLIGGIAVFLAYLVSLTVSGTLMMSEAALLAGMTLILVVGVIDDLRDMCSTNKFALQLLAAMFVVAWGGIVVTSLGSYPFIGELSLGAWAVPFTLVAVVGLVNAVNMLDGEDGLAGGVALVAFAWLLIIALTAGLSETAALIAPVVGAVAGFLIFNLRNPWRRKASVFLGDAGSMLLGFMLAWFAIVLAESQSLISPVGILWVLALPILDTLSLMARRVQKGQSPFAADREHLHHIFKRAGYNTGETTAFLIGIAFLMGAIGVVGSLIGIPDIVLLAAFAVAGVCHFVFIKFAWRTIKAMHRLRGWTGAGRDYATFWLSDADTAKPLSRAQPLALFGMYLAVVALPFSVHGMVAGYMLILLATILVLPIVVRDMRHLALFWLIAVLSIYLVGRGIITATGSQTAPLHWLDLMSISGLISMPIAWWLARLRSHWLMLFVTLLAAGGVSFALSVDWYLVSAGKLSHPLIWGTPGVTGFASAVVLLVLLAGMIAAVRNLARGWRPQFQLALCLAVSAPLVFLLVASQYVTAWLGLLAGALVLAASAVWIGVTRRQWLALVSSVVLLILLWSGFWFGVIGGTESRAQIQEPVRASILLLEGRPEIARTVHAGTVDRLAVLGQAVRVFAQQPLFGWGMDWPVQAVATDTGLHIDRLQNFYLTIGVSYGTVGLSLFGLLLIVLFREVLLAVQQRLWSSRISMSLLSVSAAVLIMLFFDNILSSPANRGIIVILIAMLASAAFENKKNVHT